MHHHHHVMVSYSLCMFCFVALCCRRDSFITHRAFCDALAEESAARASSIVTRQPDPISTDNIASINTNTNTCHDIINNNPHHPLLFSPADQQQTPLTSPFPMISSLMRRNSSSAAGCNNDSNDDEQLAVFALKREQQRQHLNEWPPSSSACNSSAHLSATALLQKAAEMGARMSSRPQQTQMAPASASTSTCTSTPRFGSTATPPSPLLMQEVELMNMSAGVDDGRGWSVVINKNRSADEMRTRTSSSDLQGSTRDFFGVEALSHKDMMFGMAALDHFGRRHPSCMTPPPFSK